MGIRPIVLLIINDVIYRPLVTTFCYVVKIEGIQTLELLKENRHTLILWAMGQLRLRTAVKRWFFKIIRHLHRIQHRPQNIKLELQYI